MIKSFGQKIKILRQKNNMRQREVAALLEMSIPAYSKLETGLVDPNFSKLIKIAKVYKIEIEQLLGVGEEGMSGWIQENTDLKNKVRELEADVINLRRKLIAMYDLEEERNRTVKAKK